LEINDYKRNVIRTERRRKESIMHSEAQKPLIVGLVGERLAGKDTVANYLVEKYGALHLKYSTVMDEVLDVLDLPRSRRNEMDVSVAMRKTFHDNVWWDAIKKKASTSTAPIVVINGNRFPDEFKLAQDFGARMIYITAPMDMLYERFARRQEKVDDNLMTRAAFEELDNEPTEVHIAGLGAQCEYKIENSGNLEELKEKVDAIITALR
jgi:dephospho-CoA kinase